MGDPIQAALVVKLATLGAGLTCVLLGFWLFLRGRKQTAGTLVCTWGDRELRLANAAPGFILALVGGVVLTLTTARGFSVSGGDPEQIATTNEEAETPEESVLEPPPSFVESRRESEGLDFDVFRQPDQPVAGTPR